MKTSTLVLRPVVPGAVGTDRENMIADEPFAKLVYGGVTIELPLDLIYRLKGVIAPEVNAERRAFNAAVSEREKRYNMKWQIIDFGLDEIHTEMAFNLEERDRCLPEIWFRDNPNKCTFKHCWNPLCLDDLDDFRKKHFEWDETLKDHADTTWQTNWRKEDEQ